MILKDLMIKIKKALDDFYKEKPSLFLGEVCERCLVHRFAVYLEKQGFNGYFVDCEYNKSSLGGPKKVSSLNGNYIDVIISKRSDGYLSGEGDLVCIEVKKDSNRKDRKKDRDNLNILVGSMPSVGGEYFYYKFGFYILFSNEKSRTKIEIYRKNKQTEVLEYRDL
jgi:hypothetical protein